MQRQILALKMPEVPLPHDATLLVSRQRQFVRQGSLRSWQPPPTPGSDDRFPHPVSNGPTSGHQAGAGGIAEQVPVEAGALVPLPGLTDLVAAHLDPGEGDAALGAEIVLEGLHRASLLAKDRSEDGVAYSDMLQDMFKGM